MRALFIIGIQFAGLMAFSQDICLTPKEYRFYAGAVIDKQTLKKDTALLKSAIKELQIKNQSFERSLVKNDSVMSLMYQKEAVYTHDIDLLRDDVDKFKKKTVRNRRLAIYGWGSFFGVATILGGLVYLSITQ